MRPIHLEGKGRKRAIMKKKKGVGLRPLLRRRYKGIFSSFPLFHPGWKISFVREKRRGEGAKGCCDRGERKSEIHLVREKVRTLREFEIKVGLLFFGGNMCFVFAD